MKKPENYRLELCESAVIIYRTDNNIGRIGLVFPDRIKKEYYSLPIPAYIVTQARQMLATAERFILYNVATDNDEWGHDILATREYIAKRNQQLSKSGDDWRWLSYKRYEEFLQART